MPDFQLSEAELDQELFLSGNRIIAGFVIMNRLAHNDMTYRDQILEHIKPEMISLASDRFMFSNMVEMIRNQGHVDIPEVRQRIPDFAPGQEEFAAGNLANLEYLLTFKPTSRQVEQALKILMTPPLTWEQVKERLRAAIAKRRGMTSEDSS